MRTAARNEADAIHCYINKPYITLQLLFVRVRRYTSIIGQAKPDDDTSIIY